jgi:hypothetical protein
MKPTRIVIGLAVAFALACLTSLSATADSISFSGTGGSFSFANTSGSTLSVTDAGINSIIDLVNSGLDSTVSSGTLDLTSGTSTSSCGSSFSTCIVTFGAGGTLTISGTDSTAGIMASTTLLSASFSDGSAIFSSAGSGTFSGDLSGISINPALASYYGITPLSGSDAQTSFDVSLAGGALSGAVGTSGVTIQDAPEPGILSQLALSLGLLGGLLFARRRVFA